MTAPFEPGDVVVCVDVSVRLGTAPDRDIALRLLKLRATYRVRDVTFWGAVHLRGVTPENGHPYAEDRFRKIDDGVTDEFREQIRALGKQSERVS